MVTMHNMIVVFMTNSSYEFGKHIDTINEKKKALAIMQEALLDDDKGKSIFIVK